MRRHAIALVGAFVLLVVAVIRVVCVPPVTGTYQSGSQRLIDAGLSVVAVDAAGREVEPHGLENIIGQGPAGGSLRPIGWKVALRTRPPQAAVVVPDVVGRRVAEAAHRIHDAGLTLNTGGWVGTNGRILSTDPSAGEVVPFGALVQYEVSVE